MPTPFETIVVAGYAVSFHHHEGAPSKEICSPTHSYHQGYIEMIVRVTADNLSVCEREETVFFLAPHEFESHDIISSEVGMTIPLVLGETIKELFFGCRTLELEGGSADYDLIIVIVEDGSEEEARSAAYLSFRHDKEEGFSELLVNG